MKTAKEFLMGQEGYADLAADYPKLHKSIVEVVEQYAKEQQPKICPNCEGNGYVIGVEAECCGLEQSECCNNPNKVQVHVKCSCDNGFIPPNQQPIDVDALLNEFAYKFYHWVKNHEKNKVVTTNDIAQFIINYIKNNPVT